MKILVQQITHTTEIDRLTSDREDVVIRSDQGGNQTVVSKPFFHQAVRFNDRPFNTSNFSCGWAFGKSQHHAIELREYFSYRFGNFLFKRI